MAALLVLAAKPSGEIYMMTPWEDPLKGNVLWKEIKRQIENLRKEMDAEIETTSSPHLMSGSALL